MNIFLVFENYFEIKPFLTNLKHKKINNKLFYSIKDDIKYYMYVNKTEGYLSLLHNLYSLKKDYNIDLLINLGIAGSLNTSIKKNSIFTIKKTVNTNLETEKVLNPPINNNICFKDSKYLITVPYLHKGYKKNWTYFGDLIDMEGYFISHFARNNSVPYILIKAVSDYNQKIEKSDCIKAAKKLFKYFEENSHFWEELKTEKYNFEIYKHLDTPLDKINTVSELSKYISEKNYSFTERNFLYNRIKIEYNKSINEYLNGKENRRYKTSVNRENGFLFIEKEIENPQKYSDYFNQYNSVKIENYLDYFQYKIRDEYSNIFIANKRGNVIKYKPEGYGLKDFINVSVTNSYNCPFDCSYCYLKGWFRSDDIVLFANKNYIWSEMKKFIKKNYKEKIIFHFGDFCDALVYDDLINSVEFFSEKIKKYNNVYIEYRTKSNNYKLLLDMKTKKNIIIGYSLSSDEIITKFEKKTVNLDKRINALREIQQSGFLISIHFDPIIFYNNLLEDYKNLVKHLRKKISNENLFSISAGTLRMPKKVYKAIKNKSSATVLKKLKKEKSMYRYPENVRKKINRKMKKMILNNFDTDKVYICMD